MCVCTIDNLIYKFLAGYQTIRTLTHFPSLPTTILYRCGIHGILATIRFSLLACNLICLTIYTCITCRFRCVLYILYDLAHLQWLLSRVHKPYVLLLLCMLSAVFKMIYTKYRKCTYDVKLFSWTKWLWYRVYGSLKVITSDYIIILRVWYHQCDLITNIIYSC